MGPSLSHSESHSEVAAPFRILSRPCPQPAVIFLNHTALPHTHQFHWSPVPLVTAHLALKPAWAQPLSPRDTGSPQAREPVRASNTAPRVPGACGRGRGWQKRGDTEGFLRAAGARGPRGDQIPHALSCPRGWLQGPTCWKSTWAKSGTCASAWRSPSASTTACGSSWSSGSAPPPAAAVGGPRPAPRLSGGFRGAARRWGAAGSKRCPGLCSRGARGYPHFADVPQLREGLPHS